MKKYFKKFIIMGFIVILTNLFWDTISELIKKNTYVLKSINYLGDFFESRESPFHAIKSLNLNGEQVTILLKEEAFIYLFKITEKESFLIFPNIKQSFNQYNPNIPYTLPLDTTKAKYYLVASRNPLKTDDEKNFLKKLYQLKRLGKIEVKEFLL